MLEFLLGKEWYAHFAEIKADLKAALLISLGVYGGLFIVICFFLQGSGDPASFKMMPSRASKKGASQSGKAAVTPSPSKASIKNTMLGNKDTTVLDTVWGVLDRDEAGKVLLTPDLVTLLMRYTMIEPTPVPVPHKPKKAEKKTEAAHVKKSTEKKQATPEQAAPEQAVPEKKVMQEKKIEKAKAKAPAVPEAPKPAAEKKIAEAVPPQTQAVPEKKAETPQQPEIAPVQEKKALQQPSKANKSEQVQETRVEAKPLKNNAQEKTEPVAKSAHQPGATATDKTTDVNASEGGSYEGSGSGYAGDIVDGIGIEFTDGSSRNDRPDSYYRQLVDEINELIKEHWRPLAGWEDAGAVVVEIKMDKNGSCTSTIISACKAGAKNHHALTIARMIGSFGKIRGRTFNLMFM